MYSIKSMGTILTQRLMDYINVFSPGDKKKSFQSSKALHLSTDWHCYEVFGLT